jgi:quercetin dioxygenase-like cupin family protein
MTRRSRGPASHARRVAWYIERMRTLRHLVALGAWVFLATAWAADTPKGDLAQRQELRRAALAATPEMEVITSLVEIRKGESIPRHTHHGIETGYVVQGTLVQLAGQAPTEMRTGSTFLNDRDVPHAGFTVVGDQSLKLLTVHVVDRDKPLYEWVR